MVDELVECGPGRGDILPACPQEVPSGHSYFLWAVRMLDTMHWPLETEAEKYHDINRTSGSFLKFIF